MAQGGLETPALVPLWHDGSRACCPCKDRSVRVSAACCSSGAHLPEPGPSLTVLGSKYLVSEMVPCELMYTVCQEGMPRPWSTDERHRPWKSCDIPAWEVWEAQSEGLVPAFSRGASRASWVVSGGSWLQPDLLTTDLCPPPPWCTEGTRPKALESF